MAVSIFTKSCLIRLLALIPLKRETTQYSSLDSMITRNRKIITSKNSIRLRLLILCLQTSLKRQLMKPLNLTSSQATPVDSTTQKSVFMWTTTAKYLSLGSWTRTVMTKTNNQIYKRLKHKKTNQISTFT